MKNMNKWKSATLICVIAAFAMTGCATDGTMSRTQKGAVVGGAAGAALGGLIGSKRANAGKGALIGGAAGAVVGGLIGRYMDKQAQELEGVAETERVGDGIIVTMKDKILFDFNSANLRSASKESLKKMADVFKKYDKTEMTVAGHTDNVGSANYNLQLSERRARAVADYLASLGVERSRMRVMGFGFERPITSNDTEEGRAQNRRVEIHIVPDEELKQEAEQQG